MDKSLPIDVVEESLDVEEQEASPQAYDVGVAGAVTGP